MRKETADSLPDALLPIRQELLDAMMVARGIEELERLLGTSKDENGYILPHPNG